jgi:hypothetical protein
MPGSQASVRGGSSKPSALPGPTVAIGRRPPGRWERRRRGPRGNSRSTRRASRSSRTPTVQSHRPRNRARWAAATSTRTGSPLVRVPVLYLLPASSRKGQVYSDTKGCLLECDVPRDRGRRRHLLRDRRRRRVRRSVRLAASALARRRDLLDDGTDGRVDALPRRGLATHQRDDGGDDHPGRRAPCGWPRRDRPHGPATASRSTP